MFLRQEQTLPVASSLPQHRPGTAAATAPTGCYRYEYSPWERPTTVAEEDDVLIQEGNTCIVVTGYLSTNSCINAGYSLIQFRVTVSILARHYSSIAASLMHSQA